MVTVLRAVRNMAGESWDVWDATTREAEIPTARAARLRASVMAATFALLGGVAAWSLASICNRLADR